MYDLLDLMENFLNNPDEETAKHLSDICEDHINQIDNIAAQFGLTDMINEMNKTN